MTVVAELVNVLQRVDQRRTDNMGMPAGREFALAATALEDAIMRYNRGMAMLAGMFAVDDVEELLELTDGSDSR